MHSLINSPGKQRPEKLNKQYLEVLETNNQAFYKIQDSKEKELGFKVHAGKFLQDNLNQIVIKGRIMF